MNKLEFIYIPIIYVSKMSDSIPVAFREDHVSTCSRGPSDVGTSDTSPLSLDSCQGIVLVGVTIFIKKLEMGRIAHFGSTHQWQ